MGRLDDKIALITGATGGIGEASARAFLREGAQVMMVGRSEDKLGATRDRLGTDGSTAVFVTDATDETGVKASIDAAAQTFGGLDILFANAGTEGSVKPLTDLSAEEFEIVYRTNVIGPWLAIKHAAPALMERGGGSIIVTASIAGQIAVPGLSAYVASKHAVIGLTKNAALDLARHNIRVNAIAPGVIENRMSEDIVRQMAPDDPDSVTDAFVQAVPQRRFGSNEEVANLAVYLASDESSYCTGSVHTMDGGYTAA